MTLFVAMIHDRHLDPEPFVFKTADKAIDFARTHALLCGGERFVEEPTPEGWLYYATWSVEGDCVWVLERGLS